MHCNRPFFFRKSCGSCQRLGKRYHFRMIWVAISFGLGDWAMSRSLVCARWEIVVQQYADEASSVRESDSDLEMIIFSGSLSSVSRRSARVYKV